MKKVKVTLVLLLLTVANAFSQLSMLQIIELRKTNDPSLFGPKIRSFGDFTYIQKSEINGFEEDGPFDTYAYLYTTEWGHEWAPAWVYKNFKTGDVFYRTSFDELKFFSEKLATYSMGIETLEPNGGAWINHLMYQNMRIALFFINKSKNYYVYIT